MMEFWNVLHWYTIFSISYKSNYFCHITFILKQLSSGGLWGGLAGHTPTPPDGNLKVGTPLEKIENILRQLSSFSQPINDLILKYFKIQGGREKIF